MPGSLEAAVSRVAVLSLHTSPLVQPGRGDAGGMNVYVRELVSALAQAGADCTAYVRRWAPGLDDLVEVEPGFRVRHVTAGSVDLPKETLPAVVEEFTHEVSGMIADDPVEVIHANYWLSGVVGHRLKHDLDLPLVATFHTLARVKADTGDPEPQRRIDAEAEVVRCADVITANSLQEVGELVEHYGADPARIDVVPPGVDHAFFSPGRRRGARDALHLGDGALLLFVGRIQPLKGVDVAVRTLHELDDPEARLLVVGGASGRDGDREVRRIRALVDHLGLTGRVELVSPRPHHVLSTYYRAADVCLVPSRSESFGLVALEAAACGTPVVASDVGGLRTLVEHGVTGLRVADRDPAEFAAAVRRVLDDPLLAARLSADAVEKAADYTWASTAGRLRRIYADVSARAPLDCLA
ncbi:MAG: glycosyltransferase [Acidimicrobiales bacterium]